jgi:hypothetical protein
LNVRMMNFHLMSVWAIGSPIDLESYPLKY